MWHYVIRVNHVTVYRIIQLNYFNITKPNASVFLTSTALQFQRIKVSFIIYSNLTRDYEYSKKIGQVHLLSPSSSNTLQH